MTWSLMTHTLSCACQERAMHPVWNGGFGALNGRGLRRWRGQDSRVLAQGLGETEISTPKLKIQEEEGFRFRLVEL